MSKFIIPPLSAESYDALPEGMTKMMKLRPELGKKLENTADRGKKAMIETLKDFPNAFKTTIDAFIRADYTMELLYQLLWDLGISRAQDNEKLPNIDMTFGQLSKKSKDTGNGKFLKYFQIFYMSVGIKLVADGKYNSVIARYRGVQVTIKRDEEETVIKVDEHGFIPQIMYALSGATEQKQLNIIMSQEDRKMNIAATIIGYEYYKQTKGYNRSMNTLKKKIKKKDASEEEKKRAKMSKSEFIADQMGSMLNILSKGFDPKTFSQVQEASYLIGKEICRIDLSRIVNNANLAEEFLNIIRSYEGNDAESNDLDDEIKKAKEKLEEAERKRKVPPQSVAKGGNAKGSNDKGKGKVQK